MTAIIVDDEAHARRSLQTLLTIHCPNVEVVEQCSNVPLAAIAIRQHQPNLVFLDIEMPEFSGFELVKFFDDANFEIVFVTAYNDYAVKAFEFSAVDYLLKPVQVEKLKASVEKAANKIALNTMQQRLESLQSNLKNNDFNRLALPVSDGLLFVELNEIVMLEAEGAYTHVFLGNDSKVLVSRKIRFFEDLLIKHRNFFRIHRSHIVNLNFVKRYNRIDAIIQLIDNQLLPVSKDRKKHFERSFSEIRVGLKS